MAASAISDINPALVVSQLHLWRGERHLLRGVSFAIAPGELIQVMGANGVGKTSLLRCLAGLLPVESGEIHWRGQAIARNRDEYHQQLAYLAHANALKGELTATENLSFATGLRRQVSRERIAVVLDELQIPHCADLPVRALSAGQKRRVALARVLLAAAPLWILDEPITNLDRDGIATFERCMAAHLDKGGMIITAAHQKLLDGRANVRTLELH